MRLIHDNEELAATLQRLIRRSESISLAVAWASRHTAAFGQLIKAAPRLKRVVIGTHFYQTDPEVLASFTDSNTVKFILQPEGVFHPKVYFFQKADTWTLIIGSANFTRGALVKNSEAMIEVNSSDVSCQSIKADTVRLIESYWKSARSVRDSDVERYRQLYAVHHRRLQKVAGTYGSTRIGKNPIESDVMSMSWSEYIARVSKDTAHGMKERIQLMSEIKKAFTRYKSFSEMPLELRKAVAGLPSNAVVNSGWFGSMVGAGKFKNVIGTNSPQISLALSHISSTGFVERVQYDAFVKDYVSAFPEGRHGLGTATRLLAMKRPDSFVCVDSKNKSNMCRELGIVQRGLDYDRYWSEVVERIHDSPWWLSKKPTDRDEAEVWESRTAFLDAIFYMP